MSSKIDRKVAVKLWTLRGIVDFYIGFDIWDRFDWYSAFFWHQGLEKLCKAYLLGKKSSVYETLPKQQARKKIDNIAKAMGHNLIEMIDKLIKRGALSTKIKRNVYARCKTQRRNLTFTGRNALKFYKMHI